MTRALSHRIKKIEKSINTKKSMDEILEGLSKDQLKALIYLDDTRDPAKVSKALGFDLKESERFVEDLIQAPTPKEYQRLSNEELIEIITTSMP